MRTRFAARSAWRRLARCCERYRVLRILECTNVKSTPGSDFHGINAQLSKQLGQFPRKLRHAVALRARPILLSGRPMLGQTGRYTRAIKE